MKSLSYGTVQLGRLVDGGMSRLHGCLQTRHEINCKSCQSRGVVAVTVCVRTRKTKQKKEKKRERTRKKYCSASMNDLFCNECKKSCYFYSLFIYIFFNYCAFCRFVFFSLVPTQTVDRLDSWICCAFQQMSQSISRALIGSFLRVHFSPRMFPSETPQG